MYGWGLANATKIVLTLFTLALLLAGVRCQAPPPGHTVVLVLIDTLRRDALGCYGNARGPTPQIDALAAEGVRFERAISTSGWTLPAVGSLLTGTWPLIHGGLGKKMVLSPIRDEVPTAAEVLREAGFATIAFANAAFLHPVLHLDRGFDLFEHRNAYNDTVRRADETIDLALERIEEQRSRSSFVLVHLFDPHLDYDPPPPHHQQHTAGRTEPAPPLTMAACRAMAPGDGTPPRPEDLAHVKGLYLGEVSFVDAQVGRLVDGLRQLGLYDSTTLIVTSDHGEEFWEHGDFEHGHTLYDELIRIPLIIKPPRALPPTARVVETQVRILDIMPTVFEIVGVAQPPSFVGGSLLGLMQGEQAEDRISFSEATLYGSDKLAWRTSRYKLIYEMNRGAELYDCIEDPAEQHDLAASRPEIVDQLRQELERFLRPLSEKAKTMSRLEPTSMSPDHLRSLRSLGYIR